MGSTRPHPPRSPPDDADHCRGHRPARLTHGTRPRGAEGRRLDCRRAPRVGTAPSALRWMAGGHHRVHRLARGPGAAGGSSHRMNRRAFVCGLTLGTLAAPLAVRAQPAEKVWRIGVLHLIPSSIGFQGFRMGLQELGYVEGQHVHLEYRWPRGQEGPETLAAQLIKSRFDVILAISSGAASAAKRVTDTVPMVCCAVGEDPVKLGMVSSLARPGGNATGTVTLALELDANRLELLKEAVPSLSRAAVLWNPSSGSDQRALPDVEAAARR